VNAREKALAMSVGGLAGLLVLVFGLGRLIVKPLRELDERTKSARAKIAEIQEDRRAYFAAEDRLKAVARRCFADTVEQASAVSGELLTRQITAAGLRESDFSRLPAGPRKLRGASEIGWTVQGSGPLTNLVNLLFLLDYSPWLHRTENLTATAGDTPGTARVHFRYLTLVMEPALEVTRTNLPARVALDSPERRLFDAIAARDLLRPYLKRPPPGPGPLSTALAAQGAPLGPENFRVVSLSEWQGQPEIHVRDLAAQKTIRFKPGDELAGGAVVMVDYRRMFPPGSPFLQSSSRIILRIGKDYWAIEGGKTFADKYQLADSQLPPRLIRQP
jgi:hypothetical protein